jgi:hypothetical protein
MTTNAIIQVKMAVGYRSYYGWKWHLPNCPRITHEPERDNTGWPWEWLRPSERCNICSDRFAATFNDYDGVACFPVIIPVPLDSDLGWGDRVTVELNGVEHPGVVDGYDNMGQCSTNDWQPTHRNLHVNLYFEVGRVVKEVEG